MEAVNKIARIMTLFFRNFDMFVVISPSARKRALFYHLKPASQVAGYATYGCMENAGRPSIPKKTSPYLATKKRETPQGFLKV
jgi:hypothetical protein